MYGSFPPITRKETILDHKNRRKTKMVLSEAVFLAHSMESKVRISAEIRAFVKPKIMRNQCKPNNDESRGKMPENPDKCESCKIPIKPPMKRVAKAENNIGIAILKVFFWVALDNAAFHQV